ncbi:hypothetical protein [Roseomonas sp. HF4]|uniref:hypothetical protein n=1 Tax=Roseomonas sp. HF4 TaxID=2562313 RepID=UPI0010C08854|nr:hypothetical protein [Roseomonas sp. HF4]
MPDGDQTRPSPPWLSAATLAAARAARRPPDPFTRSNTKQAVHDAILAHHPALPFTLIGEAVAYVLGAE